MHPEPYKERLAVHIPALHSGQKIPAVLRIAAQRIRFVLLRIPASPGDDIHSGSLRSLSAVSGVVPCSCPIEGAA